MISEIKVIVRIDNTTLNNNNNNNKVKLLFRSEKVMYVHLQRTQQI
jgi:hypothetical protein